MKASKKFVLMLTMLAFVLSMTVATAFAAYDVISATGVGLGPANRSPKSSMYKTFARQAAKLDALRQIAEYIKGVDLNSQTTVNKEGSIISDIIISSIDREATTMIAKYAKLVAEEFDSDGVCHVTMEMPMWPLKSNSAK